MPPRPGAIRTPGASKYRNQDRSTRSGGSTTNSDSLTRPLLTGTNNTRSTNTTRGGTLSNRSVMTGQSTSRSPNNGTLPRSSRPSSRKKQVVYPPPAQSVQSNFSESESESHAIFSVSETADLDMKRSETMTMRSNVPDRPVFPSEAASQSSLGGLAETTPEVVIAPTQLQPKHQLMSDEDLDSVGDFIIKGSAVGFALWIFLMVNVYVIAPADSYEYLTGAERQATWTIVILLFATNTTRIIPMAFQKNGFQFMKSGIVGKSELFSKLFLIKIYTDRR